MNGWSSRAHTQNARSLSKSPACGFCRRPAGNLPSQMDGRINYSDWIKKVGAGAANTRHSHTPLLSLLYSACVCAVGDGNIKPSARQCREVTKIEWPTHPPVCVFYSQSRSCTGSSPTRPDALNFVLSDTHSLSLARVTC